MFNHMKNALRLKFWEAIFELRILEMKTSLTVEGLERARIKAIKASYRMYAIRIAQI